jgi:hypothetical protein
VQRLIARTRSAWDALTGEFLDRTVKVNNRTVTPEPETSQDPLASFIDDLRRLRGKLVTSERFHKSGILAGELLILAAHYQSGRRPNASKLKRFLWLITEQAA